MKGVEETSVLDTIAAILTMLGGAVWGGGYVTVTVVNRIARRTLQPAERVAFFRSFGRCFGAVSAACLLVAYAFGGVLLRDHAFDATVATATGIAAAIVLATAAGVVQARSLTRARRAALAEGSLPPSVATRARRAAVLRASIGVLTLALVVLAALLAT